jgi:hypothetical protein
MDIDRFLGGNAPIGSEPLRLPVSDAFRERLEAKWKLDSAKQADMADFSCQLMIHSMVSLFIGCVGMPGACVTRCKTNAANERRMPELLDEIMAHSNLAIDGENVVITTAHVDFKVVRSPTDLCGIGVSHAAVGVKKRSWTVPLEHVEDVVFGNFEALKAGGGAESTHATPYRVLKASSDSGAPLHLIPTSVGEVAKPLPDAFTWSGEGPVDPWPQRNHGLGTVGEKGQTMFKADAWCHDIIFLADGPKAKQAILHWQHPSKGEQGKYDGGSVARRGEIPYESDGARWSHRHWYEGVWLLER